MFESYQFDTFVLQSKTMWADQKKYVPASHLSPHVSALYSILYTPLEIQVVLFDAL